MSLTRVATGAVIVWLVATPLLVWAGWPGWKLVLGYGPPEDVTISEPVTVTPPAEERVSLPISHLSKLGVRAEIARQAALYGVSVKAALRIAICESGYKWDARNARSSAAGIYQFLDSTWAAIGADGTQLDEVENIRQFMIHYPESPGMWECK